MGYTCEGNGFEQVWLFGCGNDKYLFRELKERLYSSFCRGWRNHLESSDKLSLYGQHKNYFERETYIDKLWLDVHRNALAQFRMGFFPNQRAQIPFCTDSR